MVSWFEFPCSNTNKQICYDVVLYFPARMRFFRRIAGFFGFSKDEVHDSKDGGEEEEAQGGQPSTTPVRVKETGPRKGFSVPAKVVVVDRPHLGPVLTPSTSGDGGVQGLSWYGKHLWIDEDGDVADEFLEEVSSEMPTLAVDHHKTEARFKVKGATRPVKVKKQVLSDGKLQLYVEHQGRFQWV